MLNSQRVMSLSVVLIMKTAIVGLVIGLFFLVPFSHEIAAQGIDTNLSVNTQGVYLRSCAPVVTEPTRIDLLSLGVQAGDILHLNCIGDFKYGPSDPNESASGIMAVFSSSTNLATNTAQFRVLGAIDAGVDVVTTTGSCGATDITEDFAISAAGLFIRVPTNALFLFLQTQDHSTADNSDPDGDFGLRLRRHEDYSADIKVSHVTVCWPAAYDVNYRVEYKSEVTAGVWTTLQSGIPGTGATNCVTDPITNEKRYYRVVLEN